MGKKILILVLLALGGWGRQAAWAACAAYATPNASTQAGPNSDWVRVNQVGYLNTDPKVAIAFSNNSLSGLTFSIVRTSDSAVVFGPVAFPTSSGAYSNFSNIYKLDFSAFQPSGSNSYKIQLSDGYVSVPFTISPCLYQGSEETVLNFYLAQRCGTDNKYAGAACHLSPTTGSSRMDGKVADGPLAGTLVDTEGGWHDSGDFIKFMITTTWSCASLLTAYRDNPSVFQDNLLANGQPGSNGMPDVLDEAKYALDWIIKMNPDANDLFYQVGGQEDHNLGLGTLPQNDTSAYSSSPYRPVYEGTHGGGSNNCGRAAACLALAYQIWNARGDSAYANTCLSHATQLYALGKAQAYNQPANPASFYTENGYQADMEWGAAELYRATGNASYLTDAMSYANAAGSGNGALDWSSCNFLAHYSLYPLVSAANQATLKGYMQSDVQAFQNHYAADLYGMNTGYSWGSMETLTGGVLEAQLYDKLFGVSTYAAMATASRDFLLGKNPWGVCYIVGMGTVTAHHPQHNIAVGKCIDIPGMPIEGPDTATDWAGQGITLSGPDAYAAFQGTGSNGVYHDDIQDYASNEPTSTHAGLCVYVFANLANGGACLAPTATSTCSPSSSKTPTASTTPTKTPSASLTASASPSATLTVSLSATPSKTLSAGPSNTASVTLSPIPSGSTTATMRPSPTLTASFNPTPSPAASPIDFSIWELQEPNGNTISPAQLAAGYSDAYFYLAGDGGQAFMDPQTGTPTSGSLHPRSELREMAGGAPAAWAAAGTNVLSVRGAVNQVGGGSGGHTTLAQVFDSTGGFPLCEFQYSNSLGGFQILYEEASGAGTYINLGVPMALNTSYTFALSLSNGVLTVSVNGPAAYTHTLGAGVQGDQFYFKCGNYDQTATSGTVSTTPYTIVEDYSINVVHSTGTPSPTPSITASATATATGTYTAHRTDTATVTPSVLISVSATASYTAVASSTASPTAVFSFTASPSSTSVAASHTFTATLTLSYTTVPSFTLTGSPSALATPSATGTPTALASATPTASSSPTGFSSRTPSLTPSSVPAVSASFTPSFTLTPSPSAVSTVSAGPVQAPPILYPNPWSGEQTKPLHLWLTLSAGGDVTVGIFTKAYHKLWQGVFHNQAAGNGWLLVNAPSIPHGVYYLAVEAEGKRWVLKLMVLS